MAQSTPPNNLQFVSAQDVAERAGVSRSAVSRAFTAGASVAPETREKIMHAAEQLGYQVNDLARGLLTNHSRLVGLLVTEPEVGFRALLAASLTKALIARGSIPLMINTGQTEEELAAAQRALFGHRAEATIILSGTPPASLVELARRNGQPVVVIGRSEPGVDNVHIDNGTAARCAAAMFVARGMTVVGLAGSKSATLSVVEREQAFSDEATRLGARVIAAQGSGSNYQGGVEAAQQLLCGTNRPQAIFCINDLIALGVIDYAKHKAGITVPGDLSVVGFDDLPEAGWINYDLTTFRQDPDEMARNAVAMIDRRQAEPGRVPDYVDIEAKLVVRSSFTPANLKA
jgi:DNA-binding LacI/PurR family transcriptional regulator